MWGSTWTQTRYRPTCLDRRSRPERRRLLRDRRAPASAPGSWVGPAGPATSDPTSSGAVAPGRTNGTTGAVAGVAAGWAVGWPIGLAGGATGAGRVSPILGLRVAG